MRRARKFLFSSLFIIIVAALLLSSVSPVYAAAKITAKTHQGQKSDSTYTSGNITTYSEGDRINFRFTLEGDASTSGQLQVRFTGDDGTCLFFDGTFNLGTHDGSAPAIQTVSGAAPNVTTAGSPVATAFGTSSGEWVQTLNVSFSSAGEAVVNYYLRLSPEAGECNGSSQHSRLNPAGGAVQQTGQQNVPVPANQVIELPEITVVKRIDRDGNGSFESTASAGEFCFRLDGGACVATDSSGQVIFTNVTPDGNHTITEQQLDTSQGTYDFISGSGTNCTFSGSTATANVAQGTTAKDASCTFNNGVVLGDISGAKFEDTDGDGTWDNGEPAYGGAGGWPITLYDSGWNEVKGTTTGPDGGYSFTGLMPGTYYVCEGQASGWTQTYPAGSTPNSTGDCPEGTRGWAVTVGSGQSVTGKDFGNFELASVTVCKVEDLTGDGYSQDDEPIESWLVYRDQDEQETGSDGCYTWDELGPGTSTFSEEQREGWTPTSQTSREVAIESGDDLLIRFTNSEQTVVTGSKFADLNGDGVWDSGEPGVEGWTIYLCMQPILASADFSTLANGCISTTTQTDGSYSFGQVDPGLYYVCEEQPSAWQQTYPDDSGYDCSGVEGGYGHDFEVTSGESVTGLDFGNDPDDVIISGLKFNDVNRNSANDAEPGLQGWLIHLTGKDIGGNDVVMQTVTDVDGNFSFTVEAGQYTVCESVVSGWEQTYPTSGATCVAYGSGLGHPVEPEPGDEEISDLDFGNWQKPTGDDDDDDVPPEPEVLPFLGPSIGKRASVQAASLGDTVVWTVQVARPDGVNTLSDAIPAGLDLVSATADKGTVTINGTVVTVDISAVPVGEVVTLTLQTVVNQSADTGELCNTALAGTLSAEACVDVFPLLLPPLGGRPVEPFAWGWAALAAGALGAGAWHMLRKRCLA